MSIDGPKVGIIGLGEAGNLGDDLILLATVDAVYQSLPTADITYLSHGQHLDWERLAGERGYHQLPRGLASRVEIPLLRQNSAIFQDRDVILFGGGGLLQTSHEPNRPYGWLSYLPKAGSGAPRVMATGLGLGPLSRRWLDRLHGLGSPFDIAWVRDPQSAQLAATELGWDVKQCHDFIDDSFLASLPGLACKNNHGIRRLGVALRAWPGFTIEEAVRHIHFIAAKESCDEVVFFVLESNRGEGVDVDFSRAIASRVELPTFVEVYRAEKLSSFIESMFKVNVAISMKLHSSAIWASRDIPLYPIFYAPKVAALFGQPFHGFEISSSLMAVPPAASDIPSASSTIALCLPSLLAQRIPDGSRFSKVDRVRFQMIRLVRALRRRIISPLSIRK